MNTTLNIDLEILSKIKYLAEKMRVPPSKIIIILLKRIIEDSQNIGFNSRMIQYQKRQIPSNWHKFHIQFRQDDYEFFLDLKKILKMSLSLILAYAVEKYAGEIENEKLTDKYHIQNYLIIKDQIDNIITWKIFWGLPISFKKIIRQGLAQSCNH